MEFMVTGGWVGLQECHLTQIINTTAMNSHGGCYSKLLSEILEANTIYCQLMANYTLATSYKNN